MNFSNDAIESNGEAFILEKIASFYPTNNPLTLLDVGANIGKYTATLSSSFARHTIFIHSLEPVKATFEILTQNTQQIPAKQLELHNCGLGSQNKKAPIYSDNATSALASLYKRDLAHLNISMLGQKEHVEIRTLNSFCEENRITHIHLLKLDTEGSEYSILENSRNKINSRAIDFIQFEFGSTCMGAKIYFQDIFNLLEPHYRVYRLLKDGIQEYPSYNASYEIFALGTYLAVSREIKKFQL